MSEQTPQREIRMVHVLRPRFDLSPRVREEIIEFLTPVNGTPTIMGVYATRMIVVDAEAYHSDAYARTLTPQARLFENTNTHIHFGIARNSRNQGLKHPPAISFKDEGKGAVQVALRPRLTASDTFNSMLSIFNFDEYEHNEALRPYEDITARNGNNYLYAEIAHAALRSSTSGYKRSDAIRAFTEAAADPVRNGQDYYATTQELTGRDRLMPVEVRPLRLPRSAFGNGFDQHPDVA